MRYFFILIILLFFKLSLSAQDYIVVNGKDTIQCKINEITSNQLFFTILQNNIPIKSSVQMSTVNSYYFNNIANEGQVQIEQKMESIASETYVNAKREPIKVPKNYNRFRINAEIGSGYLVADTPANAPQEVKDYFEQLKTGAHYSFGGSYFIKRSYGLGIKASLFYTDNQLPISISDSFGNVINGLMKDDISITYIGAYVIGRSLAKNGISGFYYDIGVGKISYVNKAVFIDNYYITGSKLGIDFYA